MTAIPAKYVEFCKEVACLAAKLELNSVGMKFTPNYDDGWRDDISMNWAQGRHGDNAGEIRVFSTVQVFAKVDLSNKAQK
jgi:hypothetical protein